MENSRVETVQVTGSQLVERVKALLHEGNVRRVVIKQDEEVLVEFPLTVGVVGTLLAPILAAVGGIAALLTHCTIEIERQAGEVNPAPADQADQEVEAAFPLSA